MGLERGSGAEEPGLGIRLEFRTIFSENDRFDRKQRELPGARHENSDKLVAIRITGVPSF